MYGVIPKGGQRLLHIHFQQQCCSVEDMRVQTASLGRFIVNLRILGKAYTFGERDEAFLDQGAWYCAAFK